MTEKEAMSKVSLEAKYKKMAFLLSLQDRMDIISILNSQCICEARERSVLENGVMTITLKIYYKDAGNK